MFFKISLLIIILLLFYILIEKSIYFTKKENFNNQFSHKENAINNFIAYPNNQPFCPNLPTYKAKYWSKLPKSCGKGLYMKYNNTGGFYKISKILYCGKNSKSSYKIEKFDSKDIDNLQKFYDKQNEEKKKNKLDFKFDKTKLIKLKGKYVLKFKNENLFYPIQILKFKKDMGRFDIITNKVKTNKYNCKK
jgi:hypothetical protein